jgi:hypothetical protein
MMLKKLVAIPMAGAILSAAWVAAQDNENQPKPRPAKPEQARSQAEEGRQNERTGQTGDKAGWNNPDQMLAGCVTIQNQEEVALVTMAQDKLQNDEAKKFASMLIEQHQAYLTKLETFAPEAARQELSGAEHASQVDTKTNQKKDGVERAAITVTEDQSNNKQKVQQTAGTDADRIGKSGRPVDMLQIQREIAHECLTAAKSEMQGKQGIEADQCFLGYQIAKHGAMKAQLTVFQRHASPELAKVFADGAATAEKHKTEAEGIMKNLGSADIEGERRNQEKEARGDRSENK